MTLYESSLKCFLPRGTWMAQSVKHSALHFGSGHDLTVSEFEPSVRLQAGSAEPAWDSVSPPLFLPLPDHVRAHVCSLSLSKINIKKTIKK